jgi:CrcB protein
MARPDRGNELPLDPDLAPEHQPHLRPSLIAAVAIGAVIGTLARYGIDVAWPLGSSSFPLPTLLINLSGAFVLGLLIETLVRRGDDSGPRRVVRLVAGTGVWGAFTTYSALAVQSDLLFRGHHIVIGVAYGVASVVGGLIATSVGIGLGASKHRVHPS